MVRFLEIDIFKLHDTEVGIRQLCLTKNVIPKGSINTNFRVNLATANLGIKPRISPIIIHFLTEIVHQGMVMAPRISLKMANIRLFMQCGPTVSESLSEQILQSVISSRETIRQKQILKSGTDATSC